MTQKDKKLLLKDLCARLPYGLKIRFIAVKDNSKIVGEIEGIEQTGDVSFSYWSKAEKKYIIMYSCLYEDYIKPYLRPMSSMTEKEHCEYNSFSLGEDWISNPYMSVPSFHVMDWLNEHHFDYRGLIEKGFALKAPKRMYKED